MDTVVVHGMRRVIIDLAEDYARARAEHFPNAGVEYGPDLYSDEMGMIYVCPDCEAARRAWRR
jgi:hypothetical protein